MYPAMRFLIMIDDTSVSLDTSTLLFSKSALKCPGVLLHEFHGDTLNVSWSDVAHIHDLE